jgi:uncharacterized protein
MTTYLHPGVYIEEIPSGSKPIEGVATSVAAFIGYTTKGPLGEPVRITKYDTFSDRFGGTIDTGKAAQGDPMGHSVLAFFQNGGTTAYIVRITRNFRGDAVRAGAGETKDALKAVGYMADASPEGTTDVLRFTAVNEGTWANGLVAKLRVVPVPPGDPPLYDLLVGRKDEDGKLEPVETFPNVSLDGADPQFVTNVVNGFSDLVDVALAGLPEGSAAEEPAAVEFLGTSTSGDLSDLALPLDLTGADDAARTLTLTLDRNTPAEKVVTKLLDAKAYADLEAVATEIQGKIQGEAATEPRASFTCEVVEDRLVLTSGTRAEGSAVEVQNVGIAPTLKLGVANGGTEVKGSDSVPAPVEPAEPAEAAENETTLAGGANGSPPATADYQAVFTKFLKYRDINIILTPGQFWAAGSGNPVISAAIAHAEHMKSRMVVVDPPVSTELTTPLAVNALKLPTSTYTVLYYPWLRVANPFYHPERNPGAPDTVLVPPSGFAAGMWSKIDGRRGVWKAPAGVETGLLGVAGLQYLVENGEQDVLNPLGVNAIRAQPGFGTVIWGTRTLSTRADPEWRYVPVRRTAIMIEQSIYNGIQWAVFEPNDHRLWSALRTNIDGFMNGLFRSGAFQGEKASDAYFVRCRLGDTMTQDDIDAGRVIVVVGFAPLKPAEFVIVRIQQKVGQQ